MAEERSGARFFSGRGMEIAVGCIPVVVVLAHLDLPLQEDALFWWVPQALEIAERGPLWAPSGELPLACSPTETLPSQWRSGLPDYGHPPLWFHYLAAFLALIPNALAAVHWACVPVALVFGMGVVRLSRQLTGADDGPIVACVILAVPAIGVQWLRPDTDLGLLVGVVWTLAFVAEGRHLAAAGVAALAVWVKEPAVLLAVPMFAAARKDGAFLGASLVPVGALLFWGWTHAAQAGWAFAESERLPESLGGWLADITTVARLIVWEGGRGAVLILALVAALVARRRSGRVEAPRHTPELLAFLVAWWIALGTVNFLGGRAVEDSYTHLRYLLPAVLAAMAVLCAIALANLHVIFPGRGRAVRSAVLGVSLLAFLPGARELSWGPESSWYGRDLAEVTRRVAEQRSDALEGANVVWVGSYLFVALTRPYAGGDWAQASLRPFGPATQPQDLSVGDGVLHASYGEPLSRLGERVLEPVWREEVGDAWIEYARVRAGRAAPPPRGSGPP